MRELDGRSTWWQRSQGEADAEVMGAAPGRDDGGAPDKATCRALASLWARHGHQEPTCGFLGMVDPF
jgi:hypothetical protein